MLVAVALWFCHDTQCGVGTKINPLDKPLREEIFMSQTTGLVVGDVCMLW